MSLLDYVLDKMHLSETDRAGLRSKRGLTAETIDRARFVSGGKYLQDVITDAARRYGIDLCVEAGLMKQSAAGVARPWHKFLEANVVIPYFDADGGVSMLRPHKLTPPGVQPQVYFANDRYDGQRITIMAESEFKAQAAVDYGYQAFGIPGISSFSGSYFELLVAQMIDRGIRLTTVIFDNEDKESPESPRFKKRAKDRYDTPFYAYVMARQLNEHAALVQARVGWIPDRYRGADYKADIDGLRAAGVSTEQFREIVESSEDPATFIETLNEEAARQVHRRAVRRFEENRKSRLIKSGGRYLYATDDGHREASNFTAEYLSTLVDREGNCAYEFRLNNQKGQEAIVVASHKDYTDWKRFRTVCGSGGLFFWSGRDEQLQSLLEMIVPEEERAVHLRDQIVGWDEELEHYLFTNCAVNANGDVVEYQEDGSLEVNGKRWRLAGEGDLPEVHFAASGVKCPLDWRRDLARLLAENFDTDDVVLALAWMCAVGLKPWLFQFNRTFPILFVFGRKGSGKTRLMQWLTRIFFNRDSSSTDTLIGQNSAPFIRNRATQLPYLPFWLDEYRNNEMAMRHLDVLRGIYDHSSAGISGGSIGTNKLFNMRCALAVSGEDEPDDPTGALNERMVSVRLPDRISGKHFQLIEQMQYSFDGIFSTLLAERERLVPAIKAEYDRLVERHRQARVSSRVSINYALLHAVAKVVLSWEFDEDDVDLLFTDMKQEAVELDPVVDMLVTCGDHFPSHGDLRLNGSMVVRLGDAPLLLFNLRRCQGAYALLGSRQRVNVAIYKTMARHVANTPWISPPMGPTKVEGRSVRMHVVDLDLAPDSIKQMAYNISDEPMKITLLNRYGNEQGALSMIE